jgi:hypothetical protein
VENRKGHHGDVGRATEILVDLAGPEPKAKTEPKAKAKPKPKAPTSAATGALDAMRADWDKARAQAAAEAEKPADPPGDATSPSKWDWRKDAERWREELGLPETPSSRTPTAADLRRQREEECLAELQAKLDSGEPLDQPPADPAGPEEVPAAESGS